VLVSAEDKSRELINGLKERGALNTPILTIFSFPLLSSAFDSAVFAVSPEPEEEQPLINTDKESSIAITGCPIRFIPVPP
jgi:hypothetical protein